MAVAKMAAVNKSFNEPEETRNMEKGKVEILNVGDVQLMRATFQPGWKWSECVKPLAGTESCEVAHLIYTISGHMEVKMNDGTNIEMGPGDMTSIPPGHDAWIVGNEAYTGLDFQGSSNYAKPKS